MKPALLLLATLVLGAPAPAQVLVRAGSDGQLAYTVDAAGNRVIDFSTAGYASGNESIPFVPVKITVAPDGT